MKKLLLLLVCALVGMTVQAEKVTEQEAFQKAQRFFGQTNQSQVGKGKTPRHSAVLTLATNRDEFYVFNDEANGGYVVISGDKRMPDVLGYSYTGHFDAENIPCNMKAWLEDYAAQVAYLRMHPEVPASRRTAPNRKGISPMLKCHFNQGKYYNEKCPIVDGKHCVTGCSATAMAQIMYYHQWPKQTTDVIPGYTTWSNRIDMPAIPVTTIDWDNMLDKYSSGKNYSDEQIDAISTLMLLCGTSVEMDYDLGGSTALSTSPPKAFRKYFDYDDLLEYVSYKGELEEWEQMIYDDLNEGHPVYYGVTTIGGRHAVVLDGYKDGYFHVNWGWGGDSDAYSLLPDLNRSNNEYYAIVGIRPNNGDNPRRYAVLDNGKMTIYYDKEISHRSGTLLPRKDDWSNYKDQITECVIDPSCANLRIKSFANFFEGLSNLKSIKGIENLNTSDATDMRSMFYGCSGLTSLDMSGFKTDNATVMSAMFYGCSSLTSLDLSGFKTDNVTTMTSMFERCYGLTTLDVSGFKTDNVTSMYHMFFGCVSLTNLDVSGFKTDNVTTMSNMFYGCYGLMSLDVSGFRTDNVTDMSSMFGNCDGLTTIYASEHWNMSNVEKSNNMFGSCINLIGGAGTTYDANHIGADYAHIDEGPDNPGYFTYKAPTSIRNIQKDKQNVKWYPLDGKQTLNSRKGLNILVMQDGTIKKIVVK